MEPWILYSIILLWVVQLFVLFSLFLLFRQVWRGIFKIGGSHFKRWDTGWNAGS